MSSQGPNYSGAISSLQQSVASLNSEVSRLQSEVRRIQAEMSSIASEIRSMSARLSNDLQAVRAGVDISNTELAAILAASGGILSQTTATASNVRTLDDRTQGNLAKLRELSERQTSAMVQLDSIRTYTEASALSRKTTAFGKEIEQRFGKAVEGVVLNRILYDKHFGAIAEEFDSKIRTIGSHIYRIWEEDLKPVEEAARIPASSLQELAVEVDLQRLSARSSLLDSDLDMVRREHLEPLVALDAVFERTLDASFSIDGGPEGGIPIVVPAAVAIDGRGIEVAVGASLAAGELSLASTGQLPDHERYCASDEGKDRLRRRCRIRPMRPDETDRLRRALESLAERGLIDPGMLPAYHEYLEKVPLGIVDGTAETEEVARA